MPARVKRIEKKLGKQSPTQRVNVAAFSLCNYLQIFSF